MRFRSAFDVPQPSPKRPPSFRYVKVATRFVDSKPLQYVIITHALDTIPITVLLQTDIKTLQIRIPDQLRHDADLVLADIGLDMPTAVRLYLAKIVQTRSIPFSLTASPAPSEPVSAEPVTQEQLDAVGANREKRKKAKAATTTRKPRPP
jgi:DNA-damage-inducible protein J